MTFSRSCSAALSSSVVLLLLGGVVGACEDASNSGATLPDGSTGPFTSDGGGPGPEGSVDSSVADGAPLDAAAGDAGIPPNPARIVNFASSPAVLDLCFSSTNTNFSGVPFLKSKGLPGVPTGGMSVPFAVTPDTALSANVFFYPIEAAVGVCPGAVTSFSQLGFREDSLFVYGVGFGGVGAEAMVIAVTPPLAGKDTLGYVPASSRTVSFVPTGGGAAVVLAQSPNVNRIDTVVSGAILSTGATPDITRPFKPVNGGLVYVFTYDDKTILCDLLAPPAGGLTPCGASVRAP